MAVDEWDHCEHTVAVTPTSPPTTTFHHVDDHEDYDQEEQRPLLPPATLTTTPASRDDSCPESLVGFYGLAFLFSLVLVMLTPRPPTNLLEYELLLANLVFWCAVPVGQLLPHPAWAVMLGYALTLWTLGHLWLWLTLLHEGWLRFIFHYQRVAWVVFGQSLFLGLHVRTSQLLMVGSVASLGVLVSASWVLHG